jgi:hypothetical protein
MANEITWEEVKRKATIIADELEAFTTEARDEVFEETYEEVPDIYGTPLTKILRWYYAAHVAANHLVEAAGEGAFTSETIGAITGNKNQPVNNPQADEEYFETIYGRRYESKLAKFRKRRIVNYGVLIGSNIEGAARRVIPQP